MLRGMISRRRHWSSLGLVALVSGGLGWFVPQVVAYLSPGFHTLSDLYLGVPLAGHPDSPLGDHPEVAAFGVIDDDRIFRITVLNPRGLWTALPAGSHTPAIQNASYDPDCLIAWHIMLLAGPPEGNDPGYGDPLHWRWSTVVEFGDTQPGTVEVGLKRFTFEPDERPSAQQVGPPAQCRRLPPDPAIILPDDPAADP